MVSEVDPPRAFLKLPVLLSSVLVSVYYLIPGPPVCSGCRDCCGNSNVHCTRRPNPIRTPKMVPNRLLPLLMPARWIPLLGSTLCTSAVVRQVVALAPLLGRLLV